MLSFHSKKLTRTVELVSAAPTTTTRPKQLSVRSSLCGAINKLLGLNKSTSSSPVLVDAGVGRIQGKGKGKKAFRRSSSRKTSDRRMSCDWDCSALAVAADPLVNYRVRIEDEKALPIADSSSDLKCPELSPASSFSTLSGADSDLSSLNTLPSLLVSEAHCLGADAYADDREMKSIATRADLIMIDARARRLPLPHSLPVNFSRPLLLSSSPLSSLGGGQLWEEAGVRVTREGKVGVERGYPVSLSFVPAHIALVEGCSVEVEHM